MAQMEAVSTETQPEYEFVLLAPHEIPEVWGTVAKMLKPAVDRADGRWTIEHLFHAVYNNVQSLWVAYNAFGEIESALTTQIVTYPANTLLAIQFLGGFGYDDWADPMLAKVTEYAKAMDCDGIEAVARFGFWPMFKRNDYTKAHITYEKLFK